MSTLLGIILASALTLIIFSRAFGPNAAFRLASHLLLGMGAGYVAAIVLKQVLLPAFSSAEFWRNAQLGAVAAAGALTVLLALRFSSRPAIRAWGLLPIGLMAGVGGALALAGAMRGSLLPQLMVVEHLDFTPAHPALNVLSVALAAMTSFGVLLYLLPGAGKDETPGGRLLAGWRLWGYWALMLALGALLASTAGARITLLIDRAQYLLGLWFS